MLENKKKSSTICLSSQAMETEDDLLTSRCRVCLASNCSLFSLNSPLQELEDSSSPSILEALQRVMFTKIRSHELFPKGICETCQHVLKFAYDLNLIFQNTEATLRDYVELNKNIDDVSELSSNSNLSSDGDDDDDDDDAVEYIGSYAHSTLETDLQHILGGRRGVLERNIEAQNLTSETSYSKPGDEFRLAISKVTNTKVYLCTVCGFTFGKQRTLRKHVIVSHKDLFRPDLCDGCGYHAFMEKGPQPNYKELTSDCTWCLAKLQTPETTNLNTSNDSLPGELLDGFHSCTVCQMKFNMNANLKQHVLQSHSALLKSHFCNECSFHSLMDEYAKGITEHGIRPTQRVSQLPKEVLESRLGIEEHDSENKDSLQVLSCTRCAKFFKAREVIQDKPALPSKKTFSCRICSLECRFEFMLKRHVKSTHSEQFRKDLCEKCATTVVITGEVVANGTPPNPEFCTKCGIALGDGPYSELIQEVAKAVPKASAELKTQKKGPIIKCDKCGATFGSKATLKHHNKTKKKCTHCSEVFCSVDGLKLHLMSHKLLVSSECPFCKQKLNSKAELNLHLCNGKKKQLYKCETCPKVCTTRHGYKRHCKTHKHFKCKSCGESFTTLTELTKHTNCQHLNPPSSKRSKTRAALASGGKEHWYTIRQKLISNQVLSIKT